ncbi:hypothetical protein EDD29_6586 [Actinocorallia herbida]|uniref:Uncharacterized protein n=1 Tax=Actinocorallia herbida TaxID=58109 RepID=A0A3N1D5T0_9ACTN|nr:hypothetical protein [Actinocorallia herbida]ROO88901.1 hypothetical protein EDD29_6586 [Actinocorallia herbida]
MAWQLHYTSARSAARSGFQFTASSPGLPPGAEAAVSPYLGYRPPPDAPPAPDAAEIAGFPEALSYDVIGGRRLLVLSRYLGRDYSGRFGNFLAHAVLADADELEGLRPIEFWRAPFWAAAPAGALPVLDDPPPGDTLDPESLCHWLAALDHDPYARLAWLLDTSADRIILVCPDVEEIVRWFAVLAYSLPVETAAALSFTTYTADPVTSPHRLVGTTPDVWASQRTDHPAHPLDRPAPPHTPTPYATAVTALWRAHDLDGLDALSELARLTPATPDAAAILTSLCTPPTPEPAEPRDTPDPTAPEPAGPHPPTAPSPGSDHPTEWTAWTPETTTRPTPAPHRAQPTWPTVTTAPAPHERPTPWTPGTTEPETREGPSAWPPGATGPTGPEKREEPAWAPGTAHPTGPEHPEGRSTRTPGASEPETREGPSAWAPGATGPEHHEGRVGWTSGEDGTTGPEHDGGRSARDDAAGGAGRLGGRVTDVGEEGAGAGVGSGGVDEAAQLLVLPLLSRPDLPSWVWERLRTDLLGFDLAAAVNRLAPDPGAARAAGDRCAHLVLTSPGLRDRLGEFTLEDPAELSVRLSRELAAAADLTVLADLTVIAERLAIPVVGELTRRGAHRLTLEGADDRAVLSALDRVCDSALPALLSGVVEALERGGALLRREVLTGQVCDALAARADRIPLAAASEVSLHLLRSLAARHGIHGGPTLALAERLPGSRAADGVLAARHVATGRDPRAAARALERVDGALAGPTLLAVADALTERSPRFRAALLTSLGDRVRDLLVHRWIETAGTRARRFDLVGVALRSPGTPLDGWARELTRKRLTMLQLETYFRDDQTLRAALRDLRG